jgi:hypothetical protein
MSIQPSAIWAERGCNEHIMCHIQPYGTNNGDSRLPRITEKKIIPVPITKKISFLSVTPPPNRMPPNKFPPIEIIEYYRIL